MLAKGSALAMLPGCARSWASARRNGCARAQLSGNRGATAPRPSACRSRLRGHVRRRERPGSGVGPDRREPCLARNVGVPCPARRSRACSATSRGAPPAEAPCRPDARPERRAPRRCGVPPRIFPAPQSCGARVPTALGKVLWALQPARTARAPWSTFSRRPRSRSLSPSGTQARVTEAAEAPAVRAREWAAASRRDRAPA